MAIEVLSMDIHMTIGRRYLRNCKAAIIYEHLRHSHLDAGLTGPRLKKRSRPKTSRPGDRRNAMLRDLALLV